LKLSVKKEFTIESRVIFRLSLLFLTFRLESSKTEGYKGLRSPRSLKGNRQCSESSVKYYWLLNPFLALQKAKCRVNGYTDKTSVEGKGNKVIKNLQNLRYAVQKWSFFSISSRSSCLGRLYIFQNRIIEDSVLIFRTTRLKIKNDNKHSIV